jgi:YHS domain-containing protein
MGRSKNQISRRAFFLASFAACILISNAALAEKTNVTNGVAVQGYDPVAYFSEDAAVKGEASVTAEYNGSRYQFKNAENRDLFLANPSKYAPQYGGYCAFAVSYGELAPVDPQAFSVVEGKLYLNYSKAIRERWSADASGNIATGDRNWPSLSQ